MKIGILTYHASHNFGSMLQNYALQQFLIAEGHKVETINLRNEKQKYLFNHPLHKGRWSPSFLQIIGKFRDPKWLIEECRRWNIFEHFLKDYLILTKEYNDWDSIKNELPIINYDAIIVGSDQIWNSFCYDFDWSYFLPDNIKPTKKIAMCPSFGSAIPRTQHDRNLVSKIKKCLEDFDYLSVREKDASDYLQELLNRNVPVIADPTLIADPTIYLRMINKPIVKEPYIYYYTPSNIPDINSEHIAIELAHNLGLKIVTSFTHFMQKKTMTSIVSGPAEFLNLVKNAKLVVGKSFHLVVFSLLFHKNFITIKRKGEARIESLLGQLKVSGRNIESIEDYNHLKEIDYKVVDEELNKLKLKSISYLQNALNTKNELNH